MCHINQNLLIQIDQYLVSKSSSKAKQNLKKKMVKFLSNLLLKIKLKFFLEVYEKSVDFVVSPSHATQKKLKTMKL